MHKSRTMKTMLTITMLAVPAFATDVPFTETFEAGPANWTDSSGLTTLDWFATGGVGNSAYVSGDFNFVNNVADDTPAIIRGSGVNDASGDAFVGNWIADGVTAFSVAVRHNAPAPLNFFTRFAGPANFPGAIAVSFAPVAPGVWTDILIPIDPTNPQFVSFEGTDFNTVFSNIGRVQVGVNVPAGLAGVDATYSFDVDNVTIVPEPASLSLLALAGVGLMRRR